MGLTERPAALAAAKLTAQTVAPVSMRALVLKCPNWNGRTTPVTEVGAAVSAFHNPSPLGVERAASSSAIAATRGPPDLG